MKSFVIHSVHAACMTANDLGLQANAAVAIENGQIAWVGSTTSLPDRFRSWEQYDGEGKLLTPSLTDCHTHLVWAGSRAGEFRQRLHGASYADIAAQGGGILSTVKATRAATENELFAASLPRAQALLSQGVGHIEIKSGYGLSLVDELKQLRVARRIGAQLPLKVTTTLLAAHALPPEFKDDADGYIEHIIADILPAAVDQGLAEAVDVFCENIGFTRAQTERVFQAAQAHGLPVKLHAEQLSDQDGSALVAHYQGLSADHLEYLSESGIRAMAAAGTVAVLLPGAFYFLRETKLPPIDLLRQHGVPIAIATDANPGSSPLVQLPLMMHLACSLFRLTPEEAWLGVTRHAAAALGDQGQGTIAVGQRADLALWNLSAPEEICYEFGINPLHSLWIAGNQVS
ncbi:imidazolonepropionase [Aliidiomarina haloalkalitolerans]|uniref:Imidazolonepropionase n=1 Tax=Aliidiomarina haloalkalitolerans TaxID=859059 RepID=A0A432VRD4_9GAMM|nr:imidazolonepropionase [Aliidiomarina haloalkalitolerans]RUO18876.1 imidazolonepropionase [Aliidiomarina haloalkalitolerans]